MIKILLVEDQTMVRGALCALLEMEEDIEVVAQAENGQDGLALMRDLQFDILVTDVEMPELNGIDLLEHTSREKPQIKTIIVTTFGRAGYIRRAMAAGAMGFLLKDAPSEKLAQAIRDALRNKKTIDAELAIAALDDIDPLTQKERTALKLAGEGLNSNKIAERLCLSEGTVRNYLSEAISKLNATNRIDAARIAMQKGWL